MQFTYEYLQDNYKMLEVLRATETYRVELVLGTDRNTYIRRSIKNNIAPYDKLLDVASPYIAKTYYIAQQEKTTLVLEEYVKGASLQDLLDQQKKFSEGQVRQIALDLSYGLEALHAKGIIHRDIKPSNIILQEDGHLKLIDFNAARLKKENRKHDTKILGTEGYAPPEQYGFMPTDERSDWYAVGKTLTDIVGTDYKGSLKKAIDKCLRFDPQDRVKTAEEFRELLKEKQQKQWLLLALVVALVVGAGAYWCAKGNSVHEEPVAKAPEIKVEEKQAGDGAERKKKIDATTPLRMLRSKPMDFIAISDASKYPRELKCSENMILQPFELFQREKEMEHAFLVLEFKDFTLVPYGIETNPHFKDYKNYIIFMSQGDTNTGMTIKLSHYWKQHWKPYRYIYPILGTSDFKYYQLGPAPKIVAKLVFLDGQSIVRIAPIRIQEKNK